MHPEYLDPSVEDFVEFVVKEIVKEEEMYTPEEE